MRVATSPRARVAGFLLIAGLSLNPVGVAAQGVGSVEAGLLLRQLDGEKRVLMIGAHPDDEDTSMLAALARGYGARTAYLSLTRGEGGQNLIGPELDEGLGLVRTGELLAARSLDGGEQYFTRAFDFGFSKTLEETFRLWSEDEVVRDVVWVVRQFRPQVIIAVFSGTPSDGHGHHQAAGVAARRAFEWAGDPSRFPDQLSLGVEPWAPAKLYQLRRGGGAGTVVPVETGRLDPLLGRSFYQIAMEGRSQHRSQDMGASQSPGPRTSGGSLVESRVVSGSGSVVDDGLFAGIDTSLVAIAEEAEAPLGGALVAALEEYRDALGAAASNLSVLEPDAATPSLLRALDRLTAATLLAQAAGPGAGREELLAVLDRREELLTRAITATAGIVVDVRVDREHLIPGEGTGVDVLVWNGGDRRLEIQAAELRVPDGWSATGDFDGSAVIPPGTLRSWSFEVSVPTSAVLSRPYFLRSERDGELYRWPADPELLAKPGNPAPVQGTVRFAVDGSGPMDLTKDATHVDVDPASGEYRVPVHVLPPIAVTVERGTMAWPLGETGPREVAVRVSRLAGAPLQGDVFLVPPSGWSVTPESQPLVAGPSGSEAAFTFQVRPNEGTGAGPARFQALVRSAGADYSESVTMVDYPHIDPTPLIRSAGLLISYFPVAVAEGITVGYVHGPGDDGMQALADLGVDVTAIAPEELRAGSLDRFDAIVLGIRAYETRPDLVASNERLLDFVRAGGTLVVQYNQYGWAGSDLAPFPVRIARPHDRVTDPNAEVTFLDPGHPALTTPNRLADDDFVGWEQERGLYFLNEWDERYTPLLQMADPGEAPNRGSLLVARVGEGVYVYTGLALFRQFPRGVPGGFRILANLVSLRGTDL